MKPYRQHYHLVCAARTVAVRTVMDDRIDPARRQLAPSHPLRLFADTTRHLGSGPASCTESCRLNTIASIAGY